MSIGLLIHCEGAPAAPFIIVPPHAENPRSGAAAIKGRSQIDAITPDLRSTPQHERDHNRRHRNDVSALHASKLAIRRNARVAVFFGGISFVFGGMGFTAGALIGSSHLLQVQLLQKKEVPHLVATARIPHFANFAEPAHAVRPAVIAVLARTNEADLASQAHGSPEGQRSRLVHCKDAGSSSLRTATQSHASTSSREARRSRFAPTRQPLQSEGNWY
jgi:hypothetical protein